MYTSSYNKITAQTVNNGINSFSKSVTEAIVYTGNSRMVLNQTITNGDFVFPIIKFNPYTDYFTSLKSNVPILISGQGSLDFLQLDKNNDYTVIFASQTSALYPYIGHYSSDNRYTYFENNTIHFIYTGSATGNLIVEQLISSYD